MSRIGEDTISPNSPPSPSGEVLARGNLMTDGVVFTGYFHGGSAGIDRTT